MPLAIQMIEQTFLEGLMEVIPASSGKAWSAAVCDDDILMFIPFSLFLPELVPRSC